MAVTWFSCMNCGEHQEVQLKLTEDSEDVLTMAQLVHGRHAFICPECQVRSTDSYQRVWCRFCNRFVSAQSTHSCRPDPNGKLTFLHVFRRRVPGYHVVDDDAGDDVSDRRFECSPYELRCTDTAAELTLYLEHLEPPGNATALIELSAHTDRHVEVACQSVDQVVEEGATTGTTLTFHAFNARALFDGLQVGENTHYSANVILRLGDVLHFEPNCLTFRVMSSCSGLPLCF